MSLGRVAKFPPRLAPSARVRSFASLPPPDRYEYRFASPAVNVIAVICDCNDRSSPFYGGSLVVVVDEVFES